MTSQQFVHNFLTVEISTEAIQLAKQALIDYMSSSLLAKHSPELIQLKTAYQEQLSGNCLLLGDTTTATASFSALYNGFQAHLLDIDDTHGSVRGHPSAVIFSALLTELENYTGKEIVEAYVIGLEIMARLGLAINPQHYLHGWHNTGTLGGLAATGALARLKKLSEEQTLTAMSIATSQAAGLQMQFGTPIKPLHAGLAAKQAVESVRLASVGLSAKQDFLFAKRGFFSVYAEGIKQDPLFENWGKTWQIVSPGLWFKQYPFCSAAMAGADAAQVLYQKYQLTAEQIKQVEVSFFYGKDQALVNRDPLTGEEGRFSIEYIVWLGITGQEYSLEKFSTKKLTEITRQELRKVRRSYVDEPTAPYTRVVVTLKNGQQVSRNITTPKGSPDNPLTFTEQQRKFYQTVTGTRANLIEQTLMNFETKHGKELKALLQEKD